ncbi:glutamine--fructose-6-phosphate transaminase (isomerizing) [Tannockella kyphosi]|uniref:glutamine--fructose-6-phosphate transaminase (isomerizing) n=1 Tax=Tannockella kyphosi TaxID=2899121 RepID=UPI002013B4B4|nr:glutamine--fructose-6-phosphate transaminase (isomerizing) [Tannockella kyphosi]
MCGISAYIGNNNAVDFLIQGLSKLEYRGYDSAGITILNHENQFVTTKKQGKLVNLMEALKESKQVGYMGIGHTRWATHGVPCDENSHPHCNKNNTISLVHNGIIENYSILKEELIKDGYEFLSMTDSEVIVHLLDKYDNGNMLETINHVIPKLEGSYALCIMVASDKDCMYVVKKDSPIVLACDANASYVASDIPAILDYSKNVYFMDDYQIARVEKGKITFYDLEQNIIIKEPTFIAYDNQTAQMDGYESFMLKEIYEQPFALQETLRGRIVENKIFFKELKDLDKKVKEFQRVYIVGCGTAYHAGLSIVDIMEKDLQIPVSCTVASEFRYNDPIINQHTLAIFISQSGETADTLAALKLAKSKGATTLSIVNVLSSSIARTSDYTTYTCANLEIAVASTKAYTTQIATLLLLSKYMYQEKTNQLIDNQLLTELQEIPTILKTVIKDSDIFKNYAKKVIQYHYAFFLGRGLDFPTAMEGALKLKEISYIHASSYIAGELKHGSIALIEKTSPVIALALQPNIIKKTISNIQETIARGGDVILITTKPNKVEGTYATYYLPEVHPSLMPIVAAIPMQFIAYHASKLKGYDVDKPRNLAKSVTVE